MPRIIAGPGTAASKHMIASPGTSLTVNRMGYGAMQLAGAHVFGPPLDRDQAIAVLRSQKRTEVR
jgi:pyridoxine 4-dehydrogenase